MTHMSSAPIIHWLRPGVGFTPRAAASFRRVEAQRGREVSTNSTYRDYGKQMGYYRAWNAYVNGTGPKPPHSRAIHPDYSIHCRGEALDTNEWTNPDFRNLMADNGWIRTAAWDPTEQHHFEYQISNDQHLNDPAPEEDMTPEQSKKLDAVHDALIGRNSRMEKMMRAQANIDKRTLSMQKAMAAAGRITTTIGSVVKSVAADVKTLLSK